LRRGARNDDRLVRCRARPFGAGGRLASRPPGPAGRAPSRGSRRRSNRRASGSVACRSRCSR